MIIDDQLIFECDFEQKKYNFENLNYINAESTNIDRYIQSMGSEGMENEIPEQDRKSTRLNSSHSGQSRMPSSA